MRKNFFAFLLTVTLLLPSATFAQTAVRITPAERTRAEAITAGQLKNYLYFVASDAMGGRDTPSQGLDITAEFIKMQLSRWGFKGAGDNGGFFQKIELTTNTADPINNILQVEGQKFDFGSDFLRVRGTGSVNAQLVYAGHGWMVKSKSVDAFAGIDPKGKIVVLSSEGIPGANALTRLPAGVTQADLTGAKGTDWADPLAYATQRGAVGIILAASPQVQASWPQVQQFYSRTALYPEKLRETAAAVAAELPVMLASGKVRDAIFGAGAAVPDPAKASDLGKTAAMTAMSRTVSQWTQNVVALWEGSDPVLKNEMVAVGAHYDHVGTNPNARGEDKIWNGADDDGSGTVAVLSIAEALAKSKIRPKRSILFVWHAGEEKGLWGAEYFNKFPTVDIKNVIAQLNIDMIGRSKKPGDTNPKNKDLTGENAIYVIGSEMMSSTLGRITKQTNDAFMKLKYDYRYDDPADTNRFFFRSDHFHYAVNGIPIAFWFDGVHEDYHQPGDHADKIDYAKMEKITRTIFLTMWELSDLRQRPTVDKQLPPELNQQ